MTAFSLNEVNLKKLRAFLIVPHCGPVTNDLRYPYRSADLGLGTPAVIGYPGKLFILPLPCDKCKQVKSDANACLEILIWLAGGIMWALMLPRRWSDTSAYNSASKWLRWLFFSQTSFRTKHLETKLATVSRKNCHVAADFTVFPLACP